MTPREIVLEQIHHRETRPVPFTLGFEEDVGERLDAHYGSGRWRERLTPYMVACDGIDRRKSGSIEEGVDRDLFGSVWRTDQRPFHLEEPGLKCPSFDGYHFPSAVDFVDPQMKENAAKTIREHPDSFSRIGMNSPPGRSRMYAPCLVGISPA